jgi:hypothetical protein
VKCTRRCVYGPLGAWLAASPGLVRGLSAALDAKEAISAVQAFCRQQAARSLFTVPQDAMSDLAVCFFAHVAEYVGSRNPAARIAHFFGR